MYNSMKNKPYVLIYPGTAHNKGLKQASCIENLTRVLMVVQGLLLEQ